MTERLCKDCEHFEIISEPYKYIGYHTECGEAHCKKHDLYVDYLSRKKFEWLCCVEKDGVKQ